jgi:hypothetical protein
MFRDEARESRDAIFVLGNLMWVGKPKALNELEISALHVRHRGEVKDMDAGLDLSLLERKSLATLKVLVVSSKHGSLSLSLRSLT